MLAGFRRRFSPLNLLTQEEMEAIHRGALYILESTGVTVQGERALQIYANHGCRVDFHERRVRIAPGLAEESSR